MSGKVQEITEQNFQQAILEAGKPAVVDFWAEWCGPCRVVGPVVEEVAEDFGDRIVAGKLDVDSNREIAMRYGIQAIPTLLFFKNGELADKIVGAVDKRSIASKLDALLD